MLIGALSAVLTSTHPLPLALVLVLVLVVVVVVGLVFVSAPSYRDVRHFELVSSRHFEPVPRGCSALSVGLPITRPRRYGLVQAPSLSCFLSDISESRWRVDACRP